EPLRIGVAYEPRPLPEPVEILVGEVTKVRNPRSGREMTAMVEDRVRPLKMLDYGTFAATRTVAALRAYLFRPGPETRPVVDNLLAHGIAVEETTAPLETEVERFEIGKVVRSPRPFQGHREVKLEGRARTETRTYPAGTLVVRTAQPLGTLAAYLLEP